ncbi:GGDEF domain-containing protein [Glaciecola sp. KUL10]|uniref:GGDEF domain-containing protein n=1 Tax=Glaciecola sp. (strain KUL10) TaxID=2161813 RepID=UPI000D789253|nr:GGDEF domain-containing protein [Glaciecola sp. KUL10]GBL04445.1 diguanylate cyclase [Glaciecola sp. KUL10]
MNPPTPDAFSTILMVTDLESNRLEYYNSYAAEIFGIDVNTISENSLFDLISKASVIFFESYILPTIIQSGSCQEVQISVVSNAREKLPAVANVKLFESKIYWSIYLAVARDKLYQELLLARESLENKTEELTLLTRVDPLTNLLNRRALKDDVLKMINQLQRHFLPVTLLLIDIDYFKQINDMFGHDRGDEVLIRLSSALKHLIRATDLLARWGGEEFLLVLYNTDLSNAREFCKRIHCEVSKIEFDDKERLTISIGVATVKTENLTCSDVLEKCVREADVALYRAKNDGRNQTQVFDEINLD